VSAVFDAERRRGRRCSAMAPRWPASCTTTHSLLVYLGSRRRWGATRDVQPESWLDRLRYRGLITSQPRGRVTAGEWPPCRLVAALRTGREDAQLVVADQSQPSSSRQVWRGAKPTSRLALSLA
jgi:hypothetical protein